MFASRLARLEQPKSHFSISEDTLKVWGEWMTGTDPEGNYKMLKHYRKYTLLLQTPPQLNLRTGLVVKNTGDPRRLNWGLGSTT